ncbi:MAG: TlpA family protein disulfide reductase [Acidobacteriia bacterium]|nr:TlpA family protein disulfide reductase [Terriglobia bacterium]
MLPSYLASAVRAGHGRGRSPIIYHKDVTRLSIIVVGLLLLLTGCYSGTRPPRIGESAPDFSVQDSTRTVALHDYKGKVVVLNFWATWCPPCVEEMPSLVQMQSRLKDQGVTVLAVSLDVDENAYNKFLKDHNVELLAVRDPNQKSNALYGTFKFPETYIIDRQGVVRRKFIGPVDWTQPEIVSYLKRM